MQRTGATLFFGGASLLIMCLTMIAFFYQVEPMENEPVAVGDTEEALEKVEAAEVIVKEPQLTETQYEIPRRTYLSKQGLQILKTHQRIALKAELAAVEARADEQQRQRLSKGGAGSATDKHTPPWLDASGSA